MSDQQPTQAFPDQPQAAPKSQIKGTEPVELRVIIIEKADGSVDAKWQATIQGGEVVIPLRPSHLLGLLNSATFLIASDVYGTKKK